jgi:hypothetical protein
LDAALVAAHQGKIEEIPEIYKEHKRVRALLSLYEQYFKQFHLHENKEVQAAFGYSAKILRDYFNSMQAQYRADSSDYPITIETYKQIRNHTSGVPYSNSMMCLVQGINFEKIRDKNIEFQYMLDAVSTSVGVLNDYYSASRDLKSLYQRLQKAGDTPIEEVVVKWKIQSNLLLLHWKEGLSLEAATTATINEYFVHMKSFYSWKASNFIDIRKSPELRMVTYLCESFLFGHASWGVLSGRHNGSSELVGSPETVYQKIMDRTKASSCF